jgi:hypothetical protein
MKDCGLDLQAVVNRLGDECFEAHRGAFWWSKADRVAICFGNDGYAKDSRGRAKAEVEALRRFLAEYGGREVGFATEAEDGYSWALACVPPEGMGPEVLEGVLRQAWTWASHQEGAGPNTPLVLDWAAIKEGLETGRFSGLSACQTGLQANIARATLERCGLWED